MFTDLDEAGGPLPAVGGSQGGACARALTGVFV